MKRFASVEWRGNLKQGMGFISTESQKLLNVPYSYSKRFEEELGSNPEDLIAAAHAACFAMAMSSELEKMNLKAESIHVDATLTLDKSGGTWKVSNVHLSVSAYVPKAYEHQVNEAAKIAQQNCTISKLLNTNITMNFNMSPHAEIANH